MPLIQTLNFEQLSIAVKDILGRSSQLAYVSDESIKIVPAKQKDVIPDYRTYLIKLLPPDSGFILKQPKIGQYYKYIYSLAIELWIKSQTKFSDRIMVGQLSVNRGIYEFFQDVSDILEHNTLDGLLDSYPGSSIGQPVMIQDDNPLLDGIGFIWSGNQKNIK